MQTPKITSKTMNALLDVLAHAWLAGEFKTVDDYMQAVRVIKSMNLQ